MPMPEHMFAVIVTMIVILFCLIVMVFLIGPIFGGDSVKKIVCGALFWVPYGNTLRALTHGCAIIPA